MEISTEITNENIGEILRILKVGPAVLEALGEGRTDEMLHQVPAEGEWSAAELAAHLLSCTQVFGSWALYGLMSKNPSLPVVHPQRRWAKRLRYDRWPYTDICQFFTLERRALLGVLDELDEADWARPVQFRGREGNVYSAARMMVVHEAEHLGI